MNIKETQIGNSANFSLFIVTFSQLSSAKMDGTGQRQFALCQRLLLSE